MLKLKVISEWTHRCSKSKAKSCREKAMIGRTQTLNFVCHFVQERVLRQSALVLGKSHSSPCKKGHLFAWLLSTLAGIKELSNLDSLSKYSHLHFISISRSRGKVITKLWINGRVESFTHWPQPSGKTVKPADQAAAKGSWCNWCSLLSLA